MVKDGKGYIAGDMCVSDSQFQKNALNPKVFKKHGVLIGAAGSWRVINALYHALNVSKIIDKSESITEFAWNFSNAVMNLADEHGFLCRDGSEGSEVFMPDSEILVIFANKIIRVHTDFSYVILDDNYCAIGMPDHAEGVLSNSINKPEKCIKKAMAAAAKYSLGVSKEYIMLEEDQ